MHLFIQRIINDEEVKESVPVFHIEEKLTLETWDDILNRPGCQSPVEAWTFRYLRIAAVYSFKEQSARCGITHCQQAHSRGFLVISSDEKETNLCEACGQRLLDMTIAIQKSPLGSGAREKATNPPE